MIDTIVCDVHGVLLDLVGPFCNAFNFLMKDWPKGEYDFKKVTGHSFREVPEPMHFWSHLPLTPNAENFIAELVRLQQNYKIHVIYCSVAGLPEIAYGTLKSWQYHFGSMPLMTVSEAKHNFFKHNVRRLLIDDCDEELDHWRGQVYRVVRPWNRGKPGRYVTSEAFQVFVRKLEKDRLLMSSKDSLDFANKDYIQRLQEND